MMYMCAYDLVVGMEALMLVIGSYELMLDYGYIWKH